MVTQFCDYGAVKTKTSGMSNATMPEVELFN